MRKLLTWVVVTVGIAALVRRLRRRQDAPEPSGTQIATEDPADELRRKLAESRTEGTPQEAAHEATVAERRADVHGDAHAALDEMRARAEP